MGKVALITGITGQDGSYLAELLIEKGYEVHGIIRRASSFNTGRLDHIFKDLKLHYGDMLDSCSLCSIIESVRPDEIYNLAAQSHVKVSFEIPEYTAEASGVGTLRLLEAVRMCKLEKTARLYQASTSELFGQAVQCPQNEMTPFYPRSPYGVAKLYAFWIVKNFREAFNMYCVNGILFNHESPRRGRTFVTRKITEGVAKIFTKKQECLVLGNLDAVRDWGHAKDFVEAMWMMLQVDKPDDFVIATGKQTSVREFVTIAFKVVGWNIKWEGEGVDEKGIGDDGRVLVKVNPKYFRPAEVDALLGDSSHARQVLGWKPKHSLNDLVYDMLKEDLKNNGCEIRSYDECFN